MSSAINAINLLGINVAGGIILGVVFVVVLILLAMYTVWGFGRVMALPNNRSHVNVKLGKVSIKAALAYIIVIGIVARIIAAILVSGQTDYIGSLLDGHTQFDRIGLEGYLNTKGWNVMYPLTYLINGLFGKVGGLFHDADVLAFFLRLPYILADLISAFILYAIARKFVNKQVGVLVVALFMLNPMFFLNSGIAGFANSLLILSLLGTFYFMARRNTFAMLFFYGLSLLLHRDAQMLLAPMMVYLVYLVVRSIITIRRDGKAGFMKDKARNSVVVVPLTVVSVFLGMWIVSLPFVSVQYGFNPFVYLNRSFIQMIQIFDNYGVNALSLYNLFLRNGELTAYSFPALTFGIVFLILGILISAILFLSKRNRANMVLISSFIMVTIALYFINFTSATLVPSVALILLSFILIKDRRILKVFVLLSFAVSLNQLTSLVYNTTITEGFGLGLNIAMSVIAILTHIYFTMVVLDICMSSNIVVLSTEPDIGIGQANKWWWKRIGNRVSN
ncbi:MAG: glycosyltransferase family 39 protein [Firmicutes bacterium]|nr:glycosyltransferase family 39 protein [Bacillota bacterium]MCL1953185.1 glycosyltransferase family 39 protein [Bacillota bacterium]